MIKVNNVSGGQTSAYIAANYKADFNVFALVRTDDKNCIFPDKKIRQIVSDKIGKEFIGTLEMDTIIYTILDLEQFIGQKIDWVSGKTFDEVLLKKGILPNVTKRYCTTEMKLDPMGDWWLKTIGETSETRIGFRANEGRRAKNMIDKTNLNGNLEKKIIIGKHKNGNNKWENFEWQRPVFPLIEDNIYKDKIVEYWRDKPVRFAEINNCVGCFHRVPPLLKKMSIEHPNKFEWFVEQEKLALKRWQKKNNSIKSHGFAQFKHDMTYDEIKKWKLQIELDFSDFNDCDSGHCGL